MSRFDEIKRRLGAAQPDEWHASHFTREATAPSKEAWEWLLNAPADMEWLLAENRALRGLLAGDIRVALWHAFAQAAESSLAGPGAMSSGMEYWFEILEEVAEVVGPHDPKQAVKWVSHWVEQANAALGAARAVTEGQP